MLAFVFGDGGGGGEKAVPNWYPGAVLFGKQSIQF
jgi:hypothetical protein